MKIIDFKRKGNVVKFYLGKDELKDWGGDDWDDRPYEHNAERVNDEYISGEAEILFTYNYDVAEPCVGYQNSDYCKDDMKDRAVPCIVARESGSLWDDFDHITNDANAIRFYFGDKLEPGIYIYDGELKKWK